MEAARRVAGYSRGADILRRAMGKKKPEEMASKEKFLLTVQKRRIIFQKKSHEIFVLEKFAGYGFNKSHRLHME